MGSGSSSALPGGLVMVDGGVLLLALLVVLSLVRGGDPRVGLHPRGGLRPEPAAEAWARWPGVTAPGVVSLRRALWGFGGVQDCGWLLGLDVGWACGCGLVVVRGLVWFVGFSGWCGLLVWVVLGFGWVWGLGWPGFC